MAVMLSPGVYINEIDASNIAPSIVNNVAFFAGNFNSGPVDYPYVVTSKTELENTFGKPTDENYNEWFQAWKFFDYANQLVITRGYEYTDVSETPVFSDYKYKVYDYTNGTLSGNTVTVDISIDVFELPKVAIGEWVSVGSTSEVGKITDISYPAGDTEGTTLTLTIEYDTAPAVVNASDPLYVHSLRFLNGETQAISRGDVDTVNLVPTTAKANDPALNIDVVDPAEPNHINPNRLEYTYDLIKNPDEWEYYYSQDEANPLRSFKNFGAESAKLKFYSRYPDDDEIQIAIANWYDFKKENNVNYAIAFRDQNGDVTEDIFLDNLFQYYPQKDQIAIAIRKGDRLETYIVSLDPDSVDGNNKPNYIETVINEQSELVYVLDNQAINDMPASYLVCDRFGLDASGNPNPGGVPTNPLTIKGGRTVRLTEGGLREAYFSVEDKERYEIDVIIGNEYVYEDGDNLNIAIELADTRKDCIAFVGARYVDTVGKRSGDAVNAVINYITENDPVKRNGSVKLTRSMFGAFFGNYFRIYDKYNKKYRWISVCGDMAGIRCSVSATNASWWVSAGMKRGIIRGIDRMAFTPSQPQRDNLYKNGINPLVVFPGTGNLVWGNKTLYPIASAFDRINVRNLFNTLERSMSKAARSQVFEFNDVYTRNAILSMFNPYLATIKAGRGIVDYLVVCDESNNPPEVVQRNELRVDIYIKPNFAAEFIQLTFTNVGTRSFASVIGTGV